MKIVLVNTHLDPVTGGGYAHRTFALANELKRAGHHVVLVATDYMFGDSARQATQDFETIVFRCLWPRFFVPISNRTSLQTLLQGAGLVHLMGYWSILNVRVAQEARRLRIPYVICPAGALPPIGRSRLVKRVFHAVYGKSMLEGARHIIAITVKEKKELADFGVPFERIRVIPNGIPRAYSGEVDSQPFREAYGLGEAPYILFVGRLNDIKGPDILLEAYIGEKLGSQGIRLVFAGPDEGLQAKLKKRAVQAGLVDRVLFTGFIDNENKRRAYCGSLFLAVPSRSEAMSLVVLEAAACGKPVLLTDRCGFDEVGEVGGGMVTPATVAGIRVALQKMMAMSMEERQAAGAKLRDYVTQHFTWPALIQQLLA